ncbi:MAG: O-antigen ligase family protein [Elusimicrobiota bacterium]
MVLPALVALTVGLGPILRGSWDLWAQSLFHLATAAGLTLWLASRVLAGYVPLPSSRNLLWASALLLLGAAAVWTSPVHALAVPEWYNFLNALWMFPAIAALSKDERFYVDEAVRAAAWVLMVLAFYQRLVLGDARPESALVNVNVYAGAVLMLLPLALEKRDWLLAAGLGVSLWWASSVGAWLGLFAAFVLTGRWRREARFWIGLSGALVCLVVIYSKFQSPDVLNRWEWWKAAAAMAFDRPLTGYGPGSYAHVLPAYREAGGLGTLYAHQYFLQTAAEYGIPFAILWFGGLWHCLWKGGSYKRFGALAALIHSLWDWPLSMPSNLWLFSYFAASSISEGSRGVNIPSRLKVPVCALALAAGAMVTSRAWSLWAADRAKAVAAVAMAADRSQEARAAAEEALRRRPEDPEPHLILARLWLAEASSSKEHRSDLERAAARLERAAHLDPFRAATWTELATTYRRLGRPEKAEQTLARGARRCVRLRKALERARAGPRP